MRCTRATSNRDASPLGRRWASRTWLSAHSSKSISSCGAEPAPCRGLLSSRFETARSDSPTDSALDHGFVDALLDDLVADVVRAVDVETLLVETEADGARRVLHQN